MRCLPIILVQWLFLCLVSLSPAVNALDIDCFPNKPASIPHFSPTVHYSWGPREGHTLDYLIFFDHPADPFNTADGTWSLAGSSGVFLYLSPGGPGSYDITASGITLPRLFTDDCQATQILL